MSGDLYKNRKKKVRQAFLYLYIKNINVFSSILPWPQVH